MSKGFLLSAADLLCAVSQSEQIPSTGTTWREPIAPGGGNRPEAGPKARDVVGLPTPPCVCDWRYPVRYDFDAGWTWRRNDLFALFGLRPCTQSPLQ